MTTTYNLNNSKNSITKQIPLTPDLKRETFIIWLSKRDDNKFPLNLSVACLDDISEYLKSKKISCSLWEISNPNIFEYVYQKIINTKMLRIMNRNTYKVFTNVGKLYSKFLYEKPWMNTIVGLQDVYNVNTDVIKIIKDYDLKYVDRRDTGGTLWILGGMELSDLMKKIDEFGYHFIYIDGISYSLEYKGAWYYKPNTESKVQQIDITEMPKRGNLQNLIINENSNEQSIDNVGLYIRNKLRQLCESGFTFSEQQLCDICDLNWSKKSLKFLTPSSFAKIVGKSGLDTNSIKDLYDYSRYWNEIFTFGEVNLIFASQWDEENRIYFDEWYSKLNLDAWLKSDYSNLKSNREKKYDSLKHWLIENGNEKINMTFQQVANLVGGLPQSAYKHRAFWANTKSNPFFVALENAGYKVESCDLRTQHVIFANTGIEKADSYTSKKTVKAALIEFSNNYKGKIKTRSEIIEELSTKYGHNEHSILIADYEIKLNNGLPKLFRRIGSGTYECLGYSSAYTTFNSLDNTNSFASDVDKEKMIKVLIIRFKNGYRNSSNIDFERFKNYYYDEYGEEFEYDANWLKSLIVEEAFVYDDRAYIYSDEVVDRVRFYLEQIDSPCIFIDTFFNKYSSEFYTNSIFSVEMLREFIEKNFIDISVKWDYILKQDNVSPYDLIKEVFSERETWSYDELYERLPYLKMSTIRQTMNSSEYFRVDKGRYTHIDNIDLPDNEGKKLRIFVENKLAEQDYVVANELDLSKFVELNPHCSFYAVRDAVFYKFLSDSYDKNGQVITRLGVKLRVLSILEQYCRNADFVSFEELNKLESTFDVDGRTHSQCLIAGNNTMVRVSSELFVSDTYVDFDVERIDVVIELYCHDNFIPLRGITDFSLFPFAGYPWNLFLLESYVRRFSRAFKFDVRAVNSANIGVIVRKSFDYNEYDDILALALAKSLVCLNDKKAVGDFLFENGYIGWRNLGKSEEKIIKSAKVLREGGSV